MKTYTFNTDNLCQFEINANSYFEAKEKIRLAVGDECLPLKLVKVRKAKV